MHFYGTHPVDIDGELAQLDTEGYRPLRLAGFQVRSPVRRSPIVVGAGRQFAAGAQQVVQSCR
ncbi:hypothetical protein ACIQ1J_24285 [Streptomyces sp. NPDC097107]|uniref:hypothetical protein n=1 Tax=Streptomyces sp. NPDC097107 TaxID=3366089 RepID=UPI0037F2A1C9